MNYTELTAEVITYLQNSETDFVANIPVFIRQAEQRIYNSVQFPSLRKNVTGQTFSGNQYLSAPIDFLSVYSMAVYRTATTTGVGTAGQRTIVVASLNNVEVGQVVTGTGVAADTVVTGVSTGTNTIAVSEPLTATVNGSLVFQSDYVYLLNKDVNFIRQAYPTKYYKSVPQYYAIFGPTTTDDVPPELTDNLSFILGPTPDTDYAVELHYYFYPESITTAADGETWLGNNFDSVLLYGTLVEAYTYLKGEQDLIQLYDARYKDALAQAKRLGDGMERQDAYRSGQYRQPVT